MKRLLLVSLLSCLVVSQATCGIRDSVKKGFNSLISRISTPAYELSRGALIATGGAALGAVAGTVLGYTSYKDRMNAIGTGALATGGLSFVYTMKGFLDSRRQTEEKTNEVSNYAKVGAFLTSCGIFRMALKELAALKPIEESAKATLRWSLF